MRLKILFIFFISLFSLKGQSQTNKQTSLLDTSLAKKITIGGFCLCQTTLFDLQNLSPDLKQIEVEEMDLGKKCIVQDGRFENGKGYYSDQFSGMIFQKDQNTNQISKIRLTKDFKGNLPDGPSIDLKNLKLRDVFEIYPNLKEKWNSRGCSDYWHFDNDTLFFYVKIDTTKKPQFPIDEAYYYDKPIEAIDLLVSCYHIFQNEKDEFVQLFDDPVFFIDSVNVTRIELQKYKPDEIAFVNVYKDSNAIKLVGEQGKFGAVYFETKKFVRNKYWDFLKSKSTEYLKIVPTPESDSSVIYILNDSILGKNSEASLADINDETFIELKVIDKKTLRKTYKVFDKTFGIFIKTIPKDKKE